MKRKLIESMVILPENLEYIGKYGKINGMLLVEIERIMEEYAAIKVREAQAECTIPVVSGSLPLTNQKLWDMAKLITDRQRKAKEEPTDKVDWDMLEEMWFDWLEEELFGNDA